MQEAYEDIEEWPDGIIIIHCDHPLVNRYFISLTTESSLSPEEVAIAETHVLFCSQCKLLYEKIDCCKSSDPAFYNEEGELELAQGEFFFLS